MFGFTYKSVNRKSDAVIKASQNVMSQVQLVGCQEIIPKMIYEIKNKPKGANVQTPSEMKSLFQKEITNMLKFIQVSEPSKKRLENSLVNLSKIVVDNSTVSGKVDQNVARQNMVDVLSSFCPGNLMGKYTPPPKNVNVPGKKGAVLQKPVKIIDFPTNKVIMPNDFQTDNVTLDISNKYKVSYTFVIGITGKVDPETSFQISMGSINILRKGSQLKTGINTFRFTSPEAEGTLNVKFNVTAKGNNKVTIIGGSHVTVEPANSVVNTVKTAVKSTFGSISHFGSGSGLFLLFLLIVVGVLYYLHSQGKLKFPTMGQRIAQFGRDMKSIRGIRVRR